MERFIFSNTQALSRLSKTAVGRYSYFQPKSGLQARQRSLIQKRPVGCQRHCQ